MAIAAASGATRKYREPSNSSFCRNLWGAVLRTGTAGFLAGDLKEGFRGERTTRKRYRRVHVRPPSGSQISGRRRPSRWPCGHQGRSPMQIGWLGKRDAPPVAVGRETMIAPARPTSQQTFADGAVPAISDTLFQRCVDSPRWLPRRANADCSPLNDAPTNRRCGPRARRGRPWLGGSRRSRRRIHPPRRLSPRPTRGAADLIGASSRLDRHDHTFLQPLLPWHGLTRCRRLNLVLIRRGS